MKNKTNVSKRCGQCREITKSLVSSKTTSWRNILGMRRGVASLRKLGFHFLPHWMGYDCGDSFPVDFEPNGIPFGSENRQENCHHDHIPFNVKGKGNIVFQGCHWFWETKIQEISRRFPGDLNIFPGVLNIFPEYFKY